jgi:pimeloyl-ACP methyl ester carboxylesterase
MSVRSRRLIANGIDFAIDEAGEGDTVALLLHGFPESREAWHRQIPALAQLGWRVVAPDLRGYGETSRPSERSAYRIEHLTGDVAALFDQLGGRRNVLVGHDWGGVIAWQSAMQGRVELDGLVILNAPHLDVYRRALRSNWRQALRSWYVLFFQLPWLPERLMTARQGAALVRGLQRQSPNFPPEVLEIYRRNVIQPGAATAMLNYYRANLAQFGGAGGSPVIATPTLVIWGENDVALDVSLTEGLDAFVADLTLHRLPGISHWVEHDAADRVNALIGAWARSKGLTTALVAH